jgi:hypothetical protein
MTIELDHGPTIAGPGPDEVVADIVQVLRGRTVEPVDGGRIRELVESEWSRYRDARIRTFVPVLVRSTVLNELLGHHSPGMGGGAHRPAAP